MVRYRGPKLRITKRLGNLLGLTQKKVFEENEKSKPGQHGKNNKKNSTEYGLRLEEKQKLKFNYGLTESQLFRYMKEARRRNGITGVILLQLLEMRLDTICFNLGFGSTIANARQQINHGHITVNGNIVSIPSFQCRLTDIIGVKKKNCITKSYSNEFKKQKNIKVTDTFKVRSNKTRRHYLKLLQ